MAEVNALTTKIVLAGEDKASAPINKVKKEFDGLKNSLKDVKNEFAKLDEQSQETSNNVEETGKSAKKAGKDADKGTNSFTKFFNQLKRIATYRLIRSALKWITQGFREGIGNLYQWSALNDGVFKASMDNLATSMLYIKNVMGTALAPVIQDIVVPAIYAISEAVADAVNWLNQLIAILKGETTYTKAIRKQTEYAKATGGAAKELRRMLLGFDEINRLDDNKGGGGGSSVDYGGMFETAAVDEKLAASLDSLRLSIKDVFFEWENVNPEQAVEKAIVGTTGIFGGVAGFMIGGVPGALVGTVAGVAIGLIIDSATFDHDGTVSEDELRTLLRIGVGGFLGGIAGFALMKNPAGALIGFEVGAAVTALVSHFLMEPGGSGDESELKALMKYALGGFFAGIAGFMLTKSPQGFIIGASAGMILSAVLNEVDFKNGKTGSKTSLYNSMIDALMLIIAGSKAVGYLSAALGVSSGALIGFTLAVTLTLAILSVDWTGKDLLTNAIKDVESQGGSINGAVNLVKEIDKANAASAINKYQDDGKKKTMNLKSTLRADGGYVNAGSLFIAGEAGAEFVGNINGRTGVMNTDQFGEVMQPTTMAIYEIGNAIVGAVNNIPVPSVKIGDRDIYRASERGKRLTGSSLVQGAR